MPSSRAFTWLATNGGAWSLASNWDDMTDGIDPSLLAPGPADSVTIMGATGSSISAITGGGAALSALLAGNTSLSGSYAFGTLGLGASGAGGLLEVLQGSLSCGTAAILSGTALAGGGNAAITVTGLCTVGTNGGGAAQLDATGGGAIRLGTLVLAGAAGLYVDGASTMEIGSAGGAHAGVLTIDAGASLSGQGNANAYGAILNNGTITASGGDLVVGGTSGTGSLIIGGGATLTLNGATGAGQSVIFAGPQATLALATEFDEPQGTLSGFAPGDALDFIGSPVSAAIYSATGANTGVLTIYYGGQVADTLTLSGAYAGDVFLVAPDGAGGTLITVAPDGGAGGGTPSPGTATPDQYVWTAAAGGQWNSAANWTDVTTGATPAGIAPGRNDLVTIAGPQAGGFYVLDGPANAASLSLTGDVALLGGFAVGGALTVGQAGATPAAGVLDLSPGATLTASSAAIADGALSVTGSARLAIAGSISLGGGASGIGLPVSALSATAGGTVICAGLTLGGGSGDSVTTDPTGTIEIGAAGRAASGAVTVDPGATLAGNGSVNPFGAIVDNGLIAASGGTLTLGAVTGSGTLAIGANATLQLNGGTALGVAFAGANATLALANERVAASGTITGFAIGDALDILNDPITGLSTASSGGNTVLSLFYGSTRVASFTLAGSFLGQRFLLVPDGQGGTAVLLDKNNGGGSGGGGQGGTDLLSWANPGSGAWSRAGNWFDLTTNSAATAPPGTLNAVQIAGPTAGGSFQTIAGPAVCASLAFYGNTLLYGAFTAGTLAVGGTPAGTGQSLTAGIAEVAANTNLNATAATIADGAVLVSGANATLSVTGTLALGAGGTPAVLGPAGLLDVTGGGAAYLGGLVLGGGSGATMETDGTGVIEIGAAGGALAGAVTIDTGIAVAGNGAINPQGAVVLNGTLTAQGGTLLVGTVSGTGTLAIGAEATLALLGTEACPIAMTGAGATLLLQGSSETPAAPISGFAPGDSIVTGSSAISGAIFTSGAGGLGTLTLYAGTQVAGVLLLAGNYANDVFTVQPDGAGSVIGVQAAGAGGPSAGTATPDDYAWTGPASGGAWNAAGNWADMSAGQVPAAIAPGAQDFVTVTGGATGFTTLTGPANAAALTVTGDVALSGQIALGALSVGQGTATGLLALGSGTEVQAAQALIDGGVMLRGVAGLSVSGTLVLDGGVLDAASGAILGSGLLLMTGAGDGLTVDAASSLLVGAGAAFAGGMIEIAPGATLAGAGMVSPAGGIADAGTVTASGGTLTLAAPVSGPGTLLIGVGATMVLDGAAGPSLLAEFAGPGTLVAQGAVPQAAVAGFGEGDVIVLDAVSGAVDAEYAATGANEGVLTLLNASGQALASLILAGIGQDQSFTVSAGQGGGAVITTDANDWGGGGSGMGSTQTGSGSGQSGVISDFAFWQALPAYVQEVLAAFQSGVGGTSYVWTSPDGSAFGNYQPGYANFAVIAAPPTTMSGGTVALPPGYDALLAQGSTALVLDDGASNHVLLMGNAGNDTIVGFGGGDTLVGGIGGNSVIWANAGDVIYGNGNDSIITNQAGCVVTTSATGRSVVFLGAAANAVDLQGADMVVAKAGPNANDTVTAAGADTVFAPAAGELTFYGGTGADAVVGYGGTIRMVGGSGDNASLWCGNASFVQYQGGAGTAEIVGSSGELSVTGGAGAVTVFAGTGNTIIDGSAGASAFVVGQGAATVSAASGNLVWAAGSGNESLIAAGGNSTIWAAGSTGDNVLQAGNGPCTLSGGLGADTLVGGAGPALMFGGGGADLFEFTNGLAGGSATIADWSQNDQILLHGYGGYTSALTAGGETISLSDGTSITLAGVTSMAGVTIHLS